MRVEHSILVPDTSSNAYRSARRHAAWMPRVNRGRIVVSGRDRAAYLHGLLTNDVAALKSGEGCYAAYLTPQGRMITDLWVYELGDVMLITLGLAEKDGLLAKLDQFIFSEDVQLGDVTGTFSSVVVVGPEAAGVVSKVLDQVDPASIVALPEHGNVRAEYEQHAAIILRVTDLGEPGYEVLCDPVAQEGLRAAIAGLGVTELDAGTGETLRIEDGVPEFGRDMDHDTIPLEAGIESRAISLTKGCYVGQEVIIRVLHRGHGRVARRLVGLMFDGARGADAGTVLTVEGREVGHVTSAALSPALQRSIALGYLQRDFTAPGTRVNAGALAGTVSALPFSLPADPS